MNKEQVGELGKARAKDKLMGWHSASVSMAESMIESLLDPCFNSLEWSTVESRMAKWFWPDESEETRLVFGVKMDGHSVPIKKWYVLPTGPVGVSVSFVPEVFDSVSIQSGWSQSLMSRSKSGMCCLNVFFGIESDDEVSLLLSIPFTELVDMAYDDAEFSPTKFRVLSVREGQYTRTYEGEVISLWMEKVDD